MKMISFLQKLFCARLFYVVIILRLRTLISVLNSPSYWDIAVLSGRMQRLKGLIMGLPDCFSEFAY